MVKDLDNSPNDESDVTAIEYSLITAALISFAAIGVMGAIGDSLRTVFNTVAGDLDNVAGS